MLFRRMVLMILLCVFCFNTIADDGCPVGYGPVGYTQLEYIESTGTQYIDTGILAESGKSWEIEFSVGSLDNNGMIGARVGGFRFWNMLYGRMFEIGLGNDFSISYPVVVDRKYTHKLITDSNGWIAYFDGAEVGQGKDTASPTTIGGTIWLFKINAVTSSSYSGNTRIYYTKLWNGDTLIRDFIPVRRDKDRTVGMYDKVESKFYGNDGTSKFFAGPEILNAFIYPVDGECMPCPANTYKPNVGNEACTPCPTGTFSPIGSISLEQCARILNVGDSIIYMPLNKRTQIGLCTLYDGKTYCADMYEKQ